MNHTPGPWLLNHNTNWKTNPFSVTVRKPGVHSATVANIPTRMTIPPQEQQANARLIANAPALLEALQEMTNQYERLLVESRITQRDAKVMREMMPHYTGAARAVIAQATGE